MINLNYHHLYYFYVVARAGSIAKACKTLLLAQPTVSLQIKQLEKAMGRSLFAREKQRLSLTDDGRLVLDYAESIFEMGQELQDALRDRPSRQVIEIQIGIVDQVSKQVSQALLRDAFQFKAQKIEPQISAVHDTFGRLLSELRTHALDLVLSNQDVPLGQAEDFIVREVGQIPVLFVAAPPLARRIKAFPRDISSVPLLLPTRANPLRSSVEHYLNRHRIAVSVVGEIQDVELLRLLALDGIGAAPLNESAAAVDLKAGKLVCLHPKPIGIRKSVWLIAKKRRHLNTIAQHLLRNFRLRRGSFPAIKIPPSNIRVGTPPRQVSTQ